MEYRKIDKLGIETSLLGFGCMRFPTNADGKIDREKSTQMLDLARANGVNYFDTAYPYHNGESELFVGEYLAKKGCRKDLYLATKLPLWAVNSLDDAKRLFAEQLEKLQTDYIDFYLLHAVNGKRFDEIAAMGVIELMEEYQKEGKIKYFGFSFHDGYEAFEHIIKYRDWDFCQIQLNYMDTETQAGMKGYLLTEELNVPLVIMEPVKGGSLATFSEDIVDLFKKAAPDYSVASWAIRWLGTLPNVKVILSGMTQPEQVEDNLKTCNNFVPLSDAEQEALQNIIKAINDRIKNGCTGCRYCMPCPGGVDIPKMFRMWNDLGMYSNKGHVRWGYFDSTPAENRADKCIECGACEAVCPQNLPIREHLKLMHADMEALC